MKEKYVKMCPQCNSTDISANTLNPGLVSAGLFSNSYICNNCKYRGTFFPEIEQTEVQPVKKAEELPKRDLIDANYGKNINWWWGKAGPILGIVGTLFILSSFFFGQKYMFYLGVLEIIPLAIVLTITSHKQEYVKNNKIARTLLLLGLIYCYSFGPVLVVLISLWPK